MSKVTITIEGDVGSGKSALVGRIAQLMEYLNIPVTYENEQEAKVERENTRDNWQSELDMYKPSVHLVEKCTKPYPTKVQDFIDKKKTFLDNMKRTSEIVESWPEWKKNWKL